MKNSFFPPHFVVKEGIHGVGVFITTSVKKGDVLFKMKGNIVTTPTRTSVQIDKGKHIEDELAGCINHNCSPSAKVDRKIQSFVSTKDLQPGEEVTFDYNQNEDYMANPFVCECCNTLICGKLVEREKEKTSSTNLHTYKS